MQEIINKSPLIVLIITSALGAAIITTVFKFVWWGLTVSINKLRLLYNTKYELKFKRTISDYTDDFKYLTFGCLMIRHGSDEYLSHTSNDSERYAGKLKNEEIAQVSLQNIDGKALLSFSLSIHRRLGTQFKCFADIEESERKHSINFEEIEELLEQSDYIKKRRDHPVPIIKNESIFCWRILQ